MTRDVIAMSGEVDGIVLHCIDPDFFWAVLECAKCCAHPKHRQVGLVIDGESPL